MATIVVHGTMTLAPAQSFRWWWDSWGQNGFLNAVAQGMLDTVGRHDVWLVGGRKVSEIAELNPKWSLWSGRSGQFCQHQGHFTWAGSDAGYVRDAAATNLVKYLNTLHQIAPNERLRIIAHSHGCNVVKLASSDKGLLPQIRVERAVFLACPHFAGADGKTVMYCLAPSRFGAILNLYSESDTVQTELAEKLTGQPGGRMADWIPPRSFRTEQDPGSRAVYQNQMIPTEDSGVNAHTAMHGAVTGYLAGRWLLGNDLLKSKLADGRRPPPIRKGDYGEGVLQT